MTIAKLLTYWQDTLHDADLAALKLTQDNHARVSFDDVRAGQINLNSTRALFKLSGENGKSAPDSIDEKLVEVDESKPLSVIVAPITAIKQKQGRDRRSGSTCLLLIPASLDPHGRLLPDAQAPIPWIPRTVLEPTMSPLVLGEVDALDRFLEKNALEYSENDDSVWPPVYNYAWKLFKAVAGNRWKETVNEAGFSLENQAAIVPVESLRGVSGNILKVYEALLGARQYPPLLRTLADLSPAAPEPTLAHAQWRSPSKKHLGSFSSAFSLSVSQREALTNFLTLSTDTILAISGPPGTGKTTLLHSVIASLWTGAAIRQADPPVIVVSSTNNQAVTNVIDSLSGTDESTRWLPIPSYGLYLVNNQKLLSKAEKRGILAANRWDQGFPKSIEDWDFIKRAEHVYLHQAEKSFNKTFETVDDVVSALHSCLVNAAMQLERGIDLGFAIQENLAKKAQVEARYGNLDDFQAYLVRELEANDQAQAYWRALQISWLKHLENEPVLQSLLGFLPSFKRKRLYYRQAFVVEHLPDADVPELRAVEDETAVVTFIEEQMAELKRSANALENQLQTIVSLIQQLAFDIESWEYWKDGAGAHMLDPEQLFVFENADETANNTNLFNWLDTHTRHTLFQLATHYWEGRWLQTAREKELGRSNYRRGQNRQEQEAKWRRYAMLTPCFVTTMHTGPSFFDYYDGSPKPLDSFIDLLIVDEAGQVTPEVSGGMFAVAKQALVVGDAQQIEPVWSIPEPVDIENLRRRSLLAKDSGNDGLRLLREKGLMASSGSVMKMAQSVSPFQIPPRDNVVFERGLFLAEHRRCVPEVIAYCNELAYQGRLRPLRKSITEYPWPHVGYVHIKGKAERFNGSRKNEREALAIVNWLEENQRELEAHYEKPLDDIVGIVTPFAAQKGLLLQLLGSRNLRIGKTGTVHALQGGERPFVLFSPVYTTHDEATRYFFDRGPNMLNVAVSRAKDSFLAFGDMEILDPHRKTPSGILARYLFASPSNELEQVEIPERQTDKKHNEVHLVHTLDRHRRTLARAFESAIERLVIVSPFLSSRAIAADQIGRLTQTAVSKGTNVVIYTDDHLNSYFETPPTESAAKQLHASGAEIRVCHNIHSKLICIDNSIFIEGSFNWLSAERNRDEYARHETSVIYMGAEAPKFIEETLDAIDQRVVHGRTFDFAA